MPTPNPAFEMPNQEGGAGGQGNLVGRSTGSSPEVTRYSATPGVRKYVTPGVAANYSLSRPAILAGRGTLPGPGACDQANPGARSRQ